MNNVNQQEASKYIQLYLEEVGSKYSTNIQIKPKSKSNLLRFLRPIVEIFNKRFWNGYIQTIGDTIWHPDDWLEKGGVRAKLQTVAHECIHVKQSNKQGNFLHAVLYLFPQVLFLFSLLAFLSIPFGASWLWCLLFLLCLAPWPAPFRYKKELEAFRVLIVFYKHAWSTSPEMIQWAKDNIKEKLSGPDYYYCFPFKKKIIKDLNDESKLDAEQYQEIISFLRKHNLSKNEQNFNR